MTDIRRITGVMRTAVVAVVWLLACVAPAFAVPPHVTETTNTDTCAMCHRAHTAVTAMPYRIPATTTPTGTALLIAPDAARGDVSLCFTCHGIGALGASADVETSFTLDSTHSIAPLTSPYGPATKYCSSCHDSHGSDRVASGSPYPALLRSWDGTSPVFAGEEYCAACHADRDDERWDGLAVYQRTRHFSAMPTLAAGTGITCSVCHEPHGSSIAPLLRDSFVPTAAPATATITANDRMLCLACHPDPAHSWSGETTYAASAHALSPATVAISARWVAGAGRLVGECQVCHAPMGRADGTSATVPKLLEKPGRALCDSCHAPGGVASADTSSLAYPATESTKTEVVALWRPATETSWASRLAVYSRDTTGAAPRALIGPREFATGVGSGIAAAGDIDGDSLDEIVVAPPAGALVSILQPDALAGIGRQPVTAPVPAGASASALSVADVIETLPGWLNRPEVVVVTGAGDLYLYTWSGSALTTMAGPFALGAGPWGIAAGDVTGTASADLAITSAGADRLTIVTEDAGSATITVAATGPGPVGPSIGDLWASTAAAEIVVCNAGAPVDTVSLFDGSGASLADYAVSAGGGAPTASAVGDVLTALPVAGRPDVVVAFADASGDSSVVAVPQVPVGDGLQIASATVKPTGAGVRTGALLVADVESDGVEEVVTGNGGTWNRTGGTGTSIQVLRPTLSGDDLSPTTTYPGGGVEQAGSAPSLFVAELGPILPSRHPVDVGGASLHVSTETAPFARHVTCSDCHDSHEATNAVAVAPAIQGAMAGAVGVATTSSAPARATTSYAVCYRCHSAATTLAGRADIAADVSSAAVSVHAIEQASSAATAWPDSFVAGWANDDVLYCSDCHGNAALAAGQAAGPHTSRSAPILRASVSGIRPYDADALCFDCHRYAIYGSSSDTTGTSRFFDTAYATPPSQSSLHFRHSGQPASGGLGFSCDSCHVTHGSATLPHLLRSDVGYTHTAPHGGQCANACHTGGASHPYDGS